MRTITGVLCTLLVTSSSVAAQGETEGAQAGAAAAPGLEADEEWPSAVKVESSAPEGTEQPSAPGAEEPPSEERWPTAVSVEYVSRKKEESAGPYSKRVEGKLWVEAFAGPSSYDPDRFKSDPLIFLAPTLDLTTVKGPEFGVALGGALVDHSFFLGAYYRQANYDPFKLMKAGLDMQVLVRVVPYVHPAFRSSLGYARWFGGNFSGSGLRANGYSATFGVGIRVPIVRWVSFFGTFDWTVVRMFFTSREGGGDRLELAGRQFGGTFALTFHFIRTGKR
jgi:hypothetical protein